MLNSFKKFSKWHDKNEAGILQGIDIDGIIQIKTADLLFTYPTGKSAMILYGSGRLSSDILRTMLQQASKFYPDANIVWRYRASENAGRECQRLLGRFVQRFGSQPKLNESLSIQSKSIL